MGVHDGHRKRVVHRYLESGIDGMEPHQILELVLFYAIPRRDTNEIAHRLLKEFGSVSGVVDAPTDDLLKVEGIGENAAALLKLIPELTRYYYTELHTEICLNTAQKAGEYLIPRFIGWRDEVVYLVCLDAKCRAISCTLIYRGSVNSSEVNLRKAAAVALKYNASNVILAHNHPGGVALPSREDIQTTQRVREALRVIGVGLVDHIIVADDDFVSLRETTDFR